MGQNGRQAAEEIEQGENGVMAKSTKKVRGVYEKIPGARIWWVRYADGNGRIRREKVGNKGAAIQLYQKRKTQVLQGEKLPENFRAKPVSFGELAQDALDYSKAHKRSHKQDEYRMVALKEEFGARPADRIAPQELERWLAEQSYENEWAPATVNRFKALLSLTFRLGIENRKIKTNPAKLVKRRREDNGRVRFLNQFKAAKTDIPYLQAHTDEESRLRAVIIKKYPNHMPEFEIALHTGMRPSEQYGLVWDRVDLVRKLATIPKSKNGNTRHIDLNPVALAAFKTLQKRSIGKGCVFVNINGEPLKGYKHWFEDAVAEAGLEDFTWYCLRHTFASRLVMAGIDIRTVAELMGHKNIQMTMRYAHLAQAHKRAAVERLVGWVQPETSTDTRTDTSETPNA